MTDDHSTTLLLHGDPRRGERLRAMLRARGLASRSGSSPYDAAAGKGDDPACVVLELPPGSSDRPPTAILNVRKFAPRSRIIALTPRGDLAATRSAFRAGAWDCMEQSVADSELADRIREAVGVEFGRQIRPAGSLIVDAGHRTVLSAHSAFLDGLAGLRGLCRRHGEPLSIMMLDIDRFRECNERFSPAFGDHVLERFATIVKSVCRRGDIIARYEGDQFITALPNARGHDAAQLARRSRWAVGVQPMALDHATHEITFCVGIAESSMGFIETEHQLIERAAAALAEAKRQGRGRTVLWRELSNADPTRQLLKTCAPDDVARWTDRLRQHLRSTYVESTMALVAAVEAKDPCTQSHSLTVADYAESIAKRMRLPARMVDTIRAAALLHDIGKIGVPDAILTKPGPLTDDEFAIIKKHPEIALEILGHVSFLADVKPLILHHHERFDGTGYPAGLVGDRIPIGARILAVADAIDTMFSPRSYKQPYTLERVRTELESGSGRQFDPQVTTIAIQWLTETPTDFGPSITSARS